MSLPMVTCLSGLSGVFVVMSFLLIMVNLSSRLAISLEKKPELEKQA
ncbi:MAG: oxaloacetate decarboxylase subunit gamma [Syntrophomonas sp.]|nr:oxaloacetate decarboxylase subunit gamma [Syntrophomonas sp.]